MLFCFQDDDNKQMQTPDHTPHSAGITLYLSLHISSKFCSEILNYDEVTEVTVMRQKVMSENFKILIHN